MKREAITLELLLSRTVRSGDCAEWQGANDGKDGYGQVHIDGKGGVRVHRLAWELANGQPVPPGLVVRHTCDNPPCINPHHLLTGTASDNMRDMIDRHRRNQSGERNPRSVLTAAQVASIRQRVGAGESQRSQARLYGVHHSVVQQIVRGELWVSA